MQIAPFVRVTDRPPQTKWATRSNLSFVSYAADPERNLVIAMGVVDNFGKGAAGQAVQNANLICGLSESEGLDGMPVWPRHNGSLCCRSASAAPLTPDADAFRKGPLAKAERQD